MNIRQPLDPPTLFRWLSTCPARRGTVVECGAGTGEVAAFLSDRFDRALATDIQPRAAGPGGTKVVKARAEALPLAGQSVDLLVSVQALHHFDLDAHLAEARRVLRSGGVFAALSWGEVALPPPVLPAYRPALRALAPYWESRRNWVVAGYPGLAFGGSRIALPATAMRRQMDVAGLNRQVTRWSAWRNARRAGLLVTLPAPSDLALCRLGRFEVTWPMRGQLYRV